MLWIEKYRPLSFEEILARIRCPAPFIVCWIRDLPHLILTGPHGTGKSAAVECLARALYQDNWELNTSVFQSRPVFPGKITA